MHGEDGGGNYNIVMRLYWTELGNEGRKFAWGYLWVELLGPRDIGGGGGEALRI